MMNQNMIILPGIKIMKLLEYYKKKEYSGNRNDYIGRRKDWNGWSIYEKSKLSYINRKSNQRNIKSS
jgi:hypothetical protein